ncbi:universal stress protein [Trebonia sp.]|uniref:universal stress protein n=1 Tax=Trebonia sp. TaxID=2767075 RepID=UPI00260AA04A|nr:universal stress protein [Trebonia sp.]
MSRPIVVAVDGSETSLRAAEWAAAEAARRGAPLRIVSAPGLLPRMRSYQAPSTVANALRGIAARALAEAVDRVSEVTAGLLVETALLDGPPAAVVSDSGAGARLLVVGSRGAGGFSALVLGSVSRYVATHAPCPVVVVHEETGAVHREIVVGVRDPDNADAALGFAFEEAALRRANLTAVHAITWPATGPVSSAPAADSASLAAAAAAAQAAAERHLAEVLREWQQKYPEVTTAEDVVRCHPAQMLASLSARADLVVIGRHGTPGAPDGSSIQHAVLGHARGPVAIVPALSA